MTDIKISTEGIGGQGSLSLKKLDGAKEGGFDDVMREALGKVNELQSNADQAIQQLGSGGDITDTIIAMEKADVSFQMMVEVRNKLLSAYEEIMRTQV